MKNGQEKISLDYIALKIKLAFILFSLRKSSASCWSRMLNFPGGRKGSVKLRNPLYVSRRQFRHLFVPMHDEYKQLPNELKELQQEAPCDILSAQMSPH